MRQVRQTDGDQNGEVRPVFGMQRIPRLQRYSGDHRLHRRQMLRVRRGAAHRASHAQRRPGILWLQPLPQMQICHMGQTHSQLRSLRQGRDSADERCGGEVFNVYGRKGINLGSLGHDKISPRFFNKILALQLRNNFFNASSRH